MTRPATRSRTATSRGSGVSSGDRSSPVAKVSTMLVLVAVAGYFLLPVWWLVMASTKSGGELFDSNGFWFGEHVRVLDNVDELFSHSGGAFARWVFNSLLYAGGGAAVATLLSAMAGYALAKFSFRGREGVFAVVIGAVLIPPPLLALPLYLMASGIGADNTIWAVLLPSFVSPFGVYLGRVYAAASVPDELIDAARVDGAGEIRVFFTIVLRVMSPALVTIFLFQFVAIWNNFFLPLMMLVDEELWPLTLGLFYWSSQLNDRPWHHLVVTGSLISIIPLAIAFLTLQRYWRAGLTSGSVKM